MKTIELNVDKETFNLIQNDLRNYVIGNILLSADVGDLLIIINYKFYIKTIVTDIVDVPVRIISFEKLDEKDFYKEYDSSLIEIKYLETDMWNRHIYEDENGSKFINVSKYHAKKEIPENLHTLDYKNEPYRKVKEKYIVVTEFTKPVIENRFKNMKLS